MATVEVSDSNNATFHGHPSPPRFWVDQERESQKAVDLTQYLDKWYKENPNISPTPPPPSFFRVNTIKAAIYSHPTIGTAMDLKPITWIPQLKPLDFSSRDPFGFDCWVHDVIHGIFLFRLKSLYIGFVYVLLSIFYCWFCFLVKKDENFLVVEWWWLVGLAWIYGDGVDQVIVAAMTGDIQGRDGRHRPRLVVVVCLVF